MPLDDAVNPEPSEETTGEPTESSESGKSTRKERASKTRGYVAQLAQNQQTLESRLGRIEGLIEGLAKGQKPEAEETDESDPWSQIPEEKLASFINDPDQIQQNPHLVPHAILKLAQKMTKKETAKLRDEIQQSRQSTITEVDSHLQMQKGVQEYVQMAVEDFGEDVTNPESDLFIAADAQYRAFEKKYGKDDVARKPELIYTAVRRAAKQVGLPVKATDEASPPTESPQTTESASSVEDLGLGVSDSQAVRQAGEEVRSLIDKEDFRGAAKRMVAQMGYQD